MNKQWKGKSPKPRMITIREAVDTLNKLLADIGAAKEVPYQMIYNYAKQGKIKSNVNQPQRRHIKAMVEFESFMKWAEGYLTRLVNKQRNN